MPTPFVHLTYALEILSHRATPVSLLEILSPAAGDFLLGNTAADIQTLTRASRLSTHFYSVRGAQTCWGWEQMLGEYPELANPHQLDSKHAAFISGYLVHLLWDEIWTREIFTPYFMNASGWPDRLSYVLHHNALRVIMDRKAHMELHNHQPSISLMAEVEQVGWLPFAEDYIVYQWRDWLIDQLQDGVESHTVQVLAERMGVTPDQFKDVIEKLSKPNGEQIPGLTTDLIFIHHKALAQSQALLMRYWQLD